MARMRTHGAAAQVDQFDRAGGSPRLSPHSHHLGAPGPLAPGRSAFDCRFTAMGSALDLGTFRRENGHVPCDYPDLYD